MISASFHDYFLDIAAAGGALLGLLFLAASLSPRQVFADDAPPKLSGIATSAFAALVNAFFIASVALLPGVNLGAAALAFSILGLWNSSTLANSLLHARREEEGARHAQHPARQLARMLTLVVVALLIYLLQFVLGVYLVVRPNDPIALTWLGTTLLAIYGLGLLRAWHLLGAGRHGLLWRLNPLIDDVERSIRAEPNGVES